MTTTNYEPGRIYSGAVNGERQLMLCAATGFFINAEDTCAASQVTDIRGPLVVLDHFDFQVMTRDLREGDGTAADWVADQIEQQTRPPLQIGVHQVKLPYRNAHMYLAWDGAEWVTPNGHAYDVQDLTSVRFIGPAGDDA